MNQMKRFKVRGSWPFPYDMLRYDCCYPATENDSAKLETLAREKVSTGVVELELESCLERNIPTNRRWQSFMWRVV